MLLQPSEPLARVTKMFFLLVISLSRIVYKHSVEVLPSVPKYTKAVMYSGEKIRVLRKLNSEMSYSIVGFEFNVNQSIIYSK